MPLAYNEGLHPDQFCYAAHAGFCKIYGADTLMPLDEVLRHPDYFQRVGRAMQVGDHVMISAGPPEARVHATIVLVERRVPDEKWQNGSWRFAVLGRSDAPPTPPKKAA